MVSSETNPSFGEDDEHCNPETDYYHDETANHENDPNTAPHYNLQLGDLREILSAFHHCVEEELPIILKDARAETLDSSRHCFDLRRCLRNMQELLMNEELLDLLDDEGIYSNEAMSDASFLLRMFTDDLVQLASMTTFDGRSNNGYGLKDAGIHQLYHPLIVLACQRVPNLSTLEDVHVSRLLSRVLSLIQDELSTIQSQGYSNRNNLSSMQQTNELLESLLLWFNREASGERLTQVFSSCASKTTSEVANALQVVLDFWFEVVTRHCSEFNPQLTLSIRTFINSLLDTLENVVVGVDEGDGNRNNDSTNRSYPKSLREWMSRSETATLEPSTVSNEDDIRYQRLLQTLDRYALELVEETMELLRPKPNIESCNINKDRVVNVLQYATMVTNLFSILEKDTTTSVLVGLSRSFWRSLGCFVIDEVDSLDLDQHGTSEDSEEYTTFDNEDCQIAATDILLRLTKAQIQDIVFQTSDHTLQDRTNSRSSDNHSSSCRLTEEEFSILVNTILRMLAHPEDYWTEDEQEWVLGLLQVVPPSQIALDESHICVGIKLQAVLQNVLLCIPDALSLEQQSFVHRSVEELLGKAQCISSSATQSPQRKENIETDPFIDENPWESFWPVSIYES